MHRDEVLSANTPFSDTLYAINRIDQINTQSVTENTSQEIWVTTTEGAEMTGYSAEYLEKLANTNWKMPEAERLIRVRSRSRRYELWLPDILAYRSTRLGPRIKNS